MREWGVIGTLRERGEAIWPTAPERTDPFPENLKYMSSHTHSPL